MSSSSVPLLALTTVRTVNTPGLWLLWQDSKSFHRLESGTWLSMSTHLPPLQLCLMIWAGLKSVRRAMFREMESRVTMETRLQVQPCSGILNRSSWELYNEPDRHQKLQSISAGSCGNKAVTFLWMLMLGRFDVAPCHYVTILSMRQPCYEVQTQQNPTIPRQRFFFPVFHTAPTSSSLSERSDEEAVASNFLGAHVGARVGVCVFPLRLLQVST